MNEVFQTNDCPYDLINPETLASKHKSTMKYGIYTIAYKVSAIWQNIPLEIRNSKSLSLFKSNIKQIELTLSQQSLSFIHSKSRIVAIFTLSSALVEI